MNREQLAGRFAAVIRRHFRVLADTDGVPSALLLAELAAIADDHAASERPKLRTPKQSGGKQMADS